MVIFPGGQRVRRGFTVKGWDYCNSGESQSQGHVRSRVLPSEVYSFHCYNCRVVFRNYYILKNLSSWNYIMYRTVTVRVSYVKYICSFIDILLMSKQIHTSQHQHRSTWSTFLK